MYPKSYINSTFYNDEVRLFLGYQDNIFFSFGSRNLEEYLFSIGMYFTNISIVVGDFYPNFANGMIFGDRRKKYFLKALYEELPSKPTLKPFDYYARDRDFDSLNDIAKGMGLEYSLGLFRMTTFIYSYESNPFSNLNFGITLNFGEFSILLSELGNQYFSFSYLERLNSFGINTLSIEISTLNFVDINSYGFSVFSEYFHKFFSSKILLRIAGDKFKSYYGHTFFSEPSMKNGIIFCGYRKSNNYNLTWVTKNTFSNFWDFINDTFILADLKIHNNLFFASSILSSSDQEKIFLELGGAYVYKNFYFKISGYSIFDKSLSNLLGNSVKFFLNFSNDNIIISFVGVYPLGVFEGYTFISSEMKDIFGNDIDVKLDIGKTFSFFLSSVIRFSGFSLEVIDRIYFSEISESFHGIIFKTEF